SITASGATRVSGIYRQHRLPKNSADRSWLLETDVSTIDSAPQGHHLVPGGSVKDTCPGYNHNRAPTVCVEGTSQNHGSHKRAHEALAREHEALDQNGRVDSNGTMSMNDSLNAATESHQKAFPLSKCSKKCIRAQLDSYYQKCGNARAKMVNEQAKPAMPANTSGGSAD
ncbi:hypothetical protein GM672_27395, partial [Massilia buxea]